VRDEVEAKLVPMPTGTETYVLCRSTARREKEQAIRRRFSARMEQALKHLPQRVEKGQLKDRQKIERRLGRIQARHPQVMDLYTMGITEHEGHLAVEWKLLEERRAWREAREGTYLLRTNLQGESAEELWTKYIQLTEAESAFRALKSELSIWPLFHQLEPRVKAHILVAFLGYALWVTLKHLLRQSSSDLSPARALSLLCTLQSADIVLPTTDGRELRLRRITEPSPEQKQLLQQLKIRLPERHGFEPKCSENSAIA
jgi:transposase